MAFIVSLCPRIAYPLGSHTLVTQLWNINLMAKKILHCLLNLLTIQELEEVTVTAEKNIEERTQMSSFDVSIEKIKALPVFLGRERHH